MSMLSEISLRRRNVPGRGPGEAGERGAQASFGEPGEIDRRLFKRLRRGIDTSLSYVS